MVDKLTDTHVRDLFELSKTKGNALAKSENDTIEYKESFSFDAPVMKTCAAFANNRGGYILFGIKDQSRELVGLSQSNFTRFDQYDLAKATEHLNNIFEPNIRIDKRSYKFREMSFGILYAYESEDKPVIATKNKDKIKDGEIYYSYGARRTRIEYAELHTILEEREHQKLTKFFKHVEIIAKFGVDNTAIMDTENGDVIGPKIKRFVIDKQLLDKLKFTREGEFKEIAGKPTLKLIGELTTLSDGSESNKYLLISNDQIFRVFLKQDTVNNPLEFIKGSCKGQVIYTPIYYYASMAKLNKGKLADFIDKVQDPRKHTVKRLLDRIADDDDKLQEKLAKIDTKASGFRAKFREYLTDKKSIDLKDNTIKYVSFAIRTLNSNEIDKSYIFKLLTKLYDRKSDLESGDLTNLRKAICYIDYMLYRPDE